MYNSIIMQAYECLKEYPQLKMLAGDIAALAKQIAFLESGGSYEKN